MAKRATTKKSAKTTPRKAPAPSPAPKASTAIVPGLGDMAELTLDVTALITKYEGRIWPVIKNRAALERIAAATAQGLLVAAIFQNR